jgi:hypothetical protein
MITVQGMGEQSEHFIFMIQCIHMNNIGNFNELRFESKERVLYLSNTFPLALYMEIPHYKFDSDVVIYTQFNIYIYILYYYLIIIDIIKYHFKVNEFFKYE